MNVVGKELIKLSSRQTNRKILWCWEPKGETGKTFLAKWLVVKKQACYLQMGKKTDIAHAFTGQKIVVFDLTRSDKDFLNYDVLESLKNGLFFSPKYDSRTKVFEPVKLIVMANWPPCLEKLSEDRWDIFKVGDESLPEPEPDPEPTPLNGSEMIRNGEFGRDLMIEKAKPFSLFSNGYFEME